MSRKIIQIFNPQREGSVFIALCDDGSVWERVYDAEQWVRHPDIPQDVTAKAEPPNEEEPRMMRCENADRCGNKSCAAKIPHVYTSLCAGDCVEEGFTKRKCVEVKP